MLQVAQKNVEKAGLSRKISLKVSSASAISFPDQSFDIVVSNASLHHWGNPRAVFREIRRVTVTGGFCLIKDNMRLSPLFNPLINMICFLKGMNERQHDLWVRAIRASYTVSELNILFTNSELKNAKVSINPALLDLTVECSL
jgi:ubiquinone/menaquinone biosynthesis C-methylase UbiE